MAKNIHATAFINLLWQSIAWLSSWKSLSGNEWSSECFGVSIFFLSIKFLATKPPIKLPITNPNVAEAKETVVAPATPISSNNGPKEPAVPCPPTIGIDPVHKPNNGLRLNTVAKEAPKASCNTTKSIAKARNIPTLIPPFFNIFKLAVYPILVKNAVIKIFWSVISKFIVAILVILKISTSTANNNPPITGAGIQYFESNFTFFLKYRPI